MIANYYKDDCSNIITNVYTVQDFYFGDFNIFKNSVYLGSQKIPKEEEEAVFIMDLL